MIILKRLLNFKFLNSIYFNLINLIRLSSIYFFYGPLLFKDFVVYFSAFSFISELIFFSYDQSSNKVKESLLILTNWIIVFLLFILFLSIFQNSNIFFLISLLLIDVFVMLNIKNKDKTIIKFIHIIRFLIVLLLIFKLHYFIFILNLLLVSIIYHKSKYRISLKNLNILLVSIPIVFLTRSRDTLQNLLFANYLTNENFFIFNILYRLFFNIGQINYHFVRSVNMTQLIYQKIFKIISWIKYFLFCIIPIILLFIYSVNISFLLIIYLFIILLESISNQFVLLFNHNPTRYIFKDNLIVTSLFFLLYLVTSDTNISYHSNIILVVMSFSVLLGLNYLIKNISLRNN